MNSTNFEHLVESAAAMNILNVILYFTVGLDYKTLLVSAIAPIAFFLGREHSQYEFKLIEERGLRSVNDLNPLAGFKFWKWTTDARLDLLFPILGNVSFYLAWCYVTRT